MNPRPQPVSALQMQGVPTRPLVAVLPFKGSNDDPALDRLGAEIADLLRQRLGRDPAVHDILLSSDFLAQAPEHAVELICRELRVGCLITGKCHGGPGQPSLYVELTDTREWHIRWANFYQGHARALLAEGDPEMEAMVSVLRRSLVEHPPR